MWYGRFIQICIFILTSLNNFSDAAYIAALPNSNNISNHQRYIRQVNGRCGVNTFRCISGQCIPEDGECDGKIDCEDASDETDDCKKLICNTPYLFQCTYGACIKSNLICNGAQDCRDNSDETLSQCIATNLPTNLPTGTHSTSVCGKDFKCDSGQCISEFSACDGVADCNDASDETEIVCKNVGCSKLTYTCAYGACVNKDARCNGLSECYDGSDEVACGLITGNTTSEKPPAVTPPIFVNPTPGSCRLPEFPSQGRYDVPSISPYVPGNYVGQYSAITITCRGGLIADVEFSTCFNGIWSPKLPKCVQICTPLHSTSTTKIRCTLNNEELDNCEKPLDGTYAEVICADFYEGPGPQYPNLILCKDGSWDYPINYCQPKCGQKAAGVILNLVGADDAKIGTYPWQVGIYSYDNNWNQICGGAVLNTRVIISAAHCFTVLSNGSLFPKENYMVAAGKYYRTFDHPKDNFAQYSEISLIRVPERYKGRVNNFEADLALLILATPLILTERVQPVCLDMANNFEHEQLKIGNKGIVSGWGTTTPGGNSSETLKELEIPYIPYTQCYNQAQKDFRSYITHDKICGGYLEEAKSVCQGDSGGALSFENKNDNRYYIRAVVSVSPVQETTQCNSNEYSAFTLVSHYHSLTRETLREYHNL